MKAVCRQFGYCFFFFCGSLFEKVLESFYSGDTVLVIFPDGTGPALLSCLIGGEYFALR